MTQIPSVEQIEANAISLRNMVKALLQLFPEGDGDDFDHFSYLTILGKTILDAENLLLSIERFRKATSVRDGDGPDHSLPWVWSLFWPGRVTAVFQIFFIRSRGKPPLTRLRWSWAAGVASGSGVAGKVALARLPPRATQASKHRKFHRRLSKFQDRLA
jgi:hypothetical protein